MKAEAKKAADKGKYSTCVPLIVSGNDGIMLLAAVSGIL